jgi:hypothetical protein
MNVAQAMCASFGRTPQANQSDWFKCACPVSGRQVYIVKVTRGIPALTDPAYAGLCNGLSRMKGNFQVRF